MKKSIYVLSLVALAFAACSDDMGSQGIQSGEGYKINLQGQIEQEATSRVNDEGFCDGDQFAAYIVDYTGNTPGVLQTRGNRADALRYTYDESATHWNPDHEVYFRDALTKIDVYAIYPYAVPADINAYAFQVQKDQSTAATETALCGYEASDFLWAKKEAQAPTESQIMLSFAHKLSNVSVTLLKGETFTTDEWVALDKSVLVKSVTRSVTIDLTTGELTQTGAAEATGILPYKNGDEFRAIVVPQVVDADKTLFSITLNGTPYTYSKSEAMQYLSGKTHSFSITVDKKGDAGTYTLTLASEAILPWQIDAISHDATLKEYIVVNSTAGGLQAAIEALGKDYTTLKNLKLTGEIDKRDFDFMKSSMTNLQYLNMKEVVIKRYQDSYSNFDEDEIPSQALEGKTSLLRLVLPDKLKKINSEAFKDCSHVTGSLIIPEGVTEIGDWAFREWTAARGSLNLPATLKSIGLYAFYNGGFINELQLPNGLESIGKGAFNGCNSFTGNLVLPESVKGLGEWCFWHCTGFRGSLTIPQKITKIPDNAFYSCNFDGNLNLHDGIKEIGVSAFGYCKFKGELQLPNQLTAIGAGAFHQNRFSGRLIIPSSVATLGNNAFQGCSRLSGTLEIPETVLSLGDAAFDGCNQIEKVILPNNMELIPSNLFNGCFQIGSIVCKASMPPTVLSGAFDGVAKDNFTVEVPEASLNLYKTAQGWSSFKRIAAHHELVCRPSLASALNKTHTETLVLNAEGEWEVESMPEWCTLSATSGNMKTELILTIAALTKGGGNRNGEIVFKLKDKDYRHSCQVTQYDYAAHDEDEVVTLQSKTKGAGVNIFIVGDGYSGKDIVSGKYLNDMNQEMEYFFGLPPYSTYRDYFNVYTAIPLSQESGVGTVNTIVYNKFGTTYTGGVGLQADNDALFDYATQVPTVTEENLNQTLVIVIPNSTDYGGITHMYSDGSAIAFCPMSTDDYPYDARGLIQHEAGGHGFGKLGDEYIYVNAFIQSCGCPNGGHVEGITSAKANGWFANLSLTGRMHEVEWSHLIFDPDYNDIVDVFEGGYMHTRGVFRSEQNSCMNNNIPYYSTISREAIVKRILSIAGEEYTYAKFKQNDSREPGATSRNIDPAITQGFRNYGHHEPVFYKGSPKHARKVTHHHVH